MITKVKSKMKTALQTYLARQNRTENPDGKFDSASRWYPSDSERQSCCEGVRSPSRSHPYSYMVHCRTATHVAQLYGINVDELRKLARIKVPPKREGGDSYYKLVAVHPITGKMVSVFDGCTEYKVGVTLNGHARQDHQGGYYCYRTSTQAKDSPFPEEAEGGEWDKVLLRVRSEGQYCTYGKDRKLSFSRITPLEILEKIKAVRLPSPKNCQNCPCYRKDIHEPYEDHSCNAVIGGAWLEDLKNCPENKL